MSLSNQTSSVVERCRHEHLKSIVSEDGWVKEITDYLESSDFTTTIYTDKVKLSCQWITIISESYRMHKENDHLFHANATMNNNILPTRVFSILTPWSHLPIRLLESSYSGVERMTSYLKKQGFRNVKHIPKSGIHNIVENIRFQMPAF